MNSAAKCDLFQYSPVRESHNEIYERIERCTTVAQQDDERRAVHRLLVVVQLVEDVVQLHRHEWAPATEEYCKAKSEMTTN